MPNSATIQIALKIDDQGGVRVLQNIGKESSSTGQKGKKAFTDMDRSAKSFNDSAKMSTDTLLKMGAGIGGIIGLAKAWEMLRDAGREYLSLGSDLQETQGKFDVVFKGMAETAEGWAKSLQNDYAMAETESKKYLSSIQDLLVPTGMMREDAGKLSNEFVKMAADLGSFNNLATVDVIRDIQSALQGSSETMAKYGINVKASKVEQEVFRLGLASSKEGITDAHKAQAIYNIMMREGSDAVGDMARTSDSYANQLKKATANITDLSTDIGRNLLPVATEIISEFNAWYDANKKILAQDIKGWVSGLSDFIRDSKGIVVGFVENIDAMADGLLRLAKIAAVGGVLYALPTVISATSTAFLTANLHLAAFNMLVKASSITTALTTPLWGTTAAATAATGAMGALKVAGGVLFAAYAGWEIGSWLNDNFETARLGGIAFVDGTIKGWYYVQYAANVAWAAIESGWEVTISNMKQLFAEFLEGVGAGLEHVPFAENLSASVKGYAAELKTGEGSTITFAQKQAQLKKELQETLSVHRTTIDALLTEEGVLGGVTKAIDKNGEALDRYNKKGADVVTTNNKIAALTEKELKALQEANQKKYAMDIALANQVQEDTWLIRDEGLKKSIEQAEDTQTKITQMEYDATVKSLEDQEKATEKALADQEKAYQHMFDNIHDVMADTFHSLRTEGENTFDILKDKAWDVFDQIAAKWATGLVMNAAFGGTGVGGGGGMLGALGFNGSSSGGLGAGNILSAGQGIWGAFSGGTEAAVLKFLTSGVANSVGSGIFGATAWGGAAGAELGWGANAAAASGMGTSGIAGGIAMATPFAILATGAAMLISKLTEWEPTPAIGVQGGQWDQEYAPQGSYNSKKFNFKIFGQDIGGETPKAFRDYFDDRFALVDEALNGALAETFRKYDAGAVNRGWIYTEGMDADGMLKAVSANVFKSILEGLKVESLGGGFEAFGLDFFEAIKGEQDDLFQSFVNFNSVVKNTPDFLEKFNRQVWVLGKTTIQAYNDIATITTILSAANAGLDQITSVSSITQIETMTATWATLIETLKTAGATVGELAEAERIRTATIGANLTGLTADSLATALSGAGDLNTIIDKSIQSAAYASIAQTIADKYFSGINQSIAAVWDNTGSIGAVVSAMQTIDTTLIQADIARLQAAFGLVSSGAEATTYNLTSSASSLIEFSGALRALSIEYYEAIGDTARATAMARADQVAEMQDTYGGAAGVVIRLQESIWGVQDASSAAAIANTALADATSNASAAKSNYIDALKSELRILENNLADAKSHYIDLLENELQILEDNLSKAKSDYIGLLEDEISAQEQVATSLASAVNNLHAFRDNLYVDAGVGAAGSRDSALTSVNRLVDQAMAGNVDAFGDLPDALSRFVAASESDSASYVDYARDLGMAARISSDMEAAAQSQITEAEAQANLLQNIVSAVEGVSDDVVSMDQARSNYEAAKAALDMSDYQSQIDLLTGTNQLTSDIAQADANYRDAKTALETNWYDSEINALSGISTGIQELKMAYLNAAQAQAVAQAQAAAAAQAQAQALAAAAQAQADYAAAQAQANSDLAVAQAAAQEAARKAAIVLPSAQSYFAANPDVYQSYLSGAWKNDIGEKTPEEYVMWHYGQYGYKENRSFGTASFEQSYLERNPDIAAAIQNGSYPSSASFHWLQYGQHEPREYAKGGIASGPLTGYPATLHGTEAVVPLDSGKIPVQIADDYYQELAYEVRALRDTASGYYLRQLIAEVRDLKEELAGLRGDSAGYSEVLVVNTSDAARTLANFDELGMPAERKVS